MDIQAWSIVKLAGRLDNATLTRPDIFASLGAKYRASLHAVRGGLINQMAIVSAIPSKRLLGKRKFRMDVEYGNGKTKFGPGVSIKLTGGEEPRLNNQPRRPPITLSVLLSGRQLRRKGAKHARSTRVRRAV